MGLDWLMVVVFWGVVITGIVVLIRGLGNGPGRRGGDEAQAILRRRYASGELTREQYEQMRQVLERVPQEQH